MRKIITIIAIFVIILIPLMCTVCRAENLEIKTDAFRPNNINGYSAAENKAKIIVSVLRTVGIIVAVAGIIVLGIKYIFGSVEERADYKKSMKPYLIGFIMLFTISTIATIIYDFSSALNSAVTN